mmetsp:Transcript_25673/g.26099  ORF Transcript_25673/g.26099 Transcript_25673/m.26099 type:complete len:80 (-) Transcript_25673:243-482(-)
MYVGKRAKGGMGHQSCTMTITLTDFVVGAAATQFHSIPFPSLFFPILQQYRGYYTVLVSSPSASASLPHTIDGERTSGH